MTVGQIIAALLLTAAFLWVAIAFISHAIRNESRMHRGPYKHMNSVTRVRNAKRNEK